MKKKYNIIWFDDVFHELDLIEEKAMLNGIILHGFDNAKDGIAHLEKNHMHYDAAIVDGNFYQGPEQRGSKLGEKDDALFDVGLAIESLYGRGVFPWFILSGQANFTKKRNRLADAFKESKVYDKNKDDDLDALWNDIKTAADQRLDTQIRHQYFKAFEACAAIKGDVRKHLLDILRNIHSPATAFSDELYFTPMRVILEHIFRAANELGLLHDKCMEGGKVNLSESSAFMSGKSTKYLGVKCSKAHFPKITADNVWAIITISGSASHTEGDTTDQSRVSIADYRRYVDTPYLLYSLTYQLLDILIWFKSYAQLNSDKEANKALWESISETQKEGDWILGEVTRIAENGYGTFQPADGDKTLSIIPYKVKEFDLQEKQRIHITTKLDNGKGKLLIESIKV
jgi:hypothetical protein